MGGRSHLSDIYFSNCVEVGRLFGNGAEDWGVE